MYCDTHIESPTPLKLTLSVLVALIISPCLVSPLSSSPEVTPILSCVLFSLQHVCMLLSLVQFGLCFKFYAVIHVEYVLWLAFFAQHQGCFLRGAVSVKYADECSCSLFLLFGISFMTIAQFFHSSIFRQLCCLQIFATMNIPAYMSFSMYKVPIMCLPISRIAKSYCLLMFYLGILCSVQERDWPITFLPYIIFAWFCQ